MNSTSVASVFSVASVQHSFLARQRCCAVLLGVIVLAPRAFGQQDAYGVLERAYAPYMSADDPLGFAMKVRSLAADPYKFWRGSKDLFFRWCKSNTTDWLGDTKAILPNHGDLHLGNIGTYPCEGAWNRLAFGMVDFDDTTNLPFQIELLQGLITLELTARQNGIELTEAQAQKLAGTLLDTYRVSVNSRRNATDLLLDGGDLTVAAMIQRRSISYQAQLDELTEGGKFRSAVHSENGKLKEVLQPAMDRADELAEGIARAIVNEPDLKNLFRYTEPEDIRSAIKDIARRTRLGSSGSQGLLKYFILLDRPLRGIDHDVIVYPKQQIPPAAERAGVVPRSSVNPAQRVKENMDRLTSPLPYINSWCRVGNESYWVSFAEPWGEELDPGNVKTIDDLLHMARIWATVAGATHREDGRFDVILPRLTPALLAQLRQRSSTFVKQLDQDFAAFRADPRVKAQLEATEAVIALTGPR
jgi:uncharacterized protein (DUF2252 family)